MRSAFTPALLLPALFVLPACAGAPAPVTDDRLTTAAGQLAAELVHRTYDRADAEATCKVYHRVFAPDGRLLTKGEGGEFQHHRGLFVGWNKVRRGEQWFDFWHCHSGERQEFRGFADGGEGGSQTALVAWIGGDGTEVMRERRTLRATDLGADGSRLDLHLALTADAAVALDGDPQHSGQQFRALDVFARQGAAKVRYVRPEPATAHGNDVWTNCRWTAAVLPLDGGPVTVLRVEHAGNPPATWSTRDYGRFGAMHKAVVRAGHELHLRYTYFIAVGERDAAWCERCAAAVAG